MRSTFRGRLHWGAGTLQEPGLHSCPGSVPVLCCSSRLDGKFSLEALAPAPGHRLWFWGSRSALPWSDNESELGRTSVSLCCATLPRHCTFLSAWLEFCPGQMLHWLGVEKRGCRGALSDAGYVAEDPEVAPLSHF